MHTSSQGHLTNARMHACHVCVDCDTHAMDLNVGCFLVAWLTFWGIQGVLLHYSVSQLGMMLACKTKKSRSAHALWLTTILQLID